MKIFTRMWGNFNRRMTGCFLIFDRERIGEKTVLCADIVIYIFGFLINVASITLTFYWKRTKIRSNSQLHSVYAVRTTMIIFIFLFAAIQNVTEVAEIDCTQRNMRRFVRFGGVILKVKLQVFDIWKESYHRKNKKENTSSLHS